MNLIERLGGYEAAKAEGEKWGFDEFLNDKLLEYRRQHNIYEVGDFIFHPMFGALFRVKRVDEKYVVAIAKSGYETNLLIELISHATDAEIKAGKRLEVKSDS